MDTLRLDIVPVDAAELVGRDLADISGADAKRGEARCGIPGRPTANLPARPHFAVKPHGLGLVDQAHRALVQPLGGEECVVGVGDHVHNRIADAENVEAGAGHERLCPAGRKVAARLAGHGARHKLASPRRPRHKTAHASPGPCPRPVPCCMRIHAGAAAGCSGRNARIDRRCWPSNPEWHDHGRVDRTFRQASLADHRR